MAARLRVATILIFAKAPVAGVAKTRLIPLLGAGGAAELARRMLDATCAEARHSRLQVELCASPEPSDQAWSGLLPDEVLVTDQGPGDLGQRMARAAQRTIESVGDAILIGTDCPALDRHRLQAASAALSRVDAFLHPTEDGGYALLAMRRYSARLFTDVQWSSGEVCATTVDRLQQLGWSYEVGETLRDIDEPADVLDCFDGATIEQLRSFSAGSDRLAAI